MFAGAYRKLFMLWTFVEEPSVSPQRTNRLSPHDAHWIKQAHAHDPVLHLHSLLVAQLCASFSAFLNYSVEEQRLLVRAALLHDIGKIRIPIELLQKPSPLTAEEFITVQSHAQIGYEMLVEAGETDKTLLTVTRDHHERLDGSGYPRKLTAGEISVSVRLVTLCDVFAAMTEPRPYAAPMLWDEALERMAAKSTRLDQELLSAFATMVAAMNVPKQGFSLFHNLARRKKS
ncbi:MAG: HD domain-containing protein [Acidobacteriaceae bacterium]|nr:HD domain-containing protein [Acidobacteriaceae bacterium]